VSKIDPEALSNVHYVDPEALSNVHNNNGEMFNSPRVSVRELEKPGTRGSVRKSRNKSRNSNSNSSNKSKPYNSRDYEENPFAESDEDLKYRMKALALHNGELDDSFDFSTISSRRSKSTSPTPPDEAEELPTLRASCPATTKALQDITKARQYLENEMQYIESEMISIEDQDPFNETLSREVSDTSVNLSNLSDRSINLSMSQNSNTMSNVTTILGEMIDLNSNVTLGSHWNVIPDISRELRNSRDDQSDTETVIGSESSIIRGQTIISVEGHIVFDISG